MCMLLFVLLGTFSAMGHACPGKCYLFFCRHINHQSFFHILVIVTYQNAGIIIIITQLVTQSKSIDELQLWSGRLATAVSDGKIY